MSTALEPRVWDLCVTLVPSLCSRPTQDREEWTLTP